MYNFEPINNKVLFEGVIVGILLIIFVYISSFLLKNIIKKPTLPDICDKWNNNYIMEKTLFLAGFLFHITFEFMGWNKWYAITKNKELNTKYSKFKI